MKKKRWPWPLLGAVRCTCGKLLSGHCSGEPKYRIRYYICRHHTLRSGETSHPAHRADDLESQFVELLRNTTGATDAFLVADDRQAIAKWRSLEREARRRLTDTERRIRRAWTLGEDGKIPENQLRARLIELDAERAKAEGILSDAVRAVSRAGQSKKTARSYAEILDRLADRWP